MNLQSILRIEQLFEMQEAAIWFLLPWIVGGVVALLASYTIFSTKTEKTQGMSLAVLGMQMSGKTLFYNHLRRMPYGTYAGSNYDGYESFTIKLANREIKIKKGYDIGGGEETIRQHYDKMIADSDIIVFVFNIYQYMNDISISKDTNARFEYINRKRGNKSIVMLGTHLDLFNKKEKENVIGNFKRKIAEKDYLKMFDVNFFVLNMTDIEAVHKVAEKIF